MFQRYFDEGLAQSSYLIACGRTREAVVIDPRRDIDLYVAAASQHGLTLRHAIETHVHADFVSGGHELAAIGVRVIGGPGSALFYEHHEASDGERLEVGDVSLQFLHTPGHTPEHISILATQPGEPARVFTGDTLFVGAVGRPDLLGEEQTRRLAGALYDSLREKLLRLDAAVEVHPGHGAGSLCGAGIGREPHSTIGQELRMNPLLQHTSREAFVAAVLSDLPETPPYFKRMKRVNQEGAPLLALGGGYRGVEAIDPTAAADAVREGAWIIDLRQADAFCAFHPTAALNIAYGTKVGYWAGWVVPAEARIVLIAASDSEAEEAGRQLLRVGLDNVVGYVSGGAEAWRAAGLATGRITQITARDLQDRVSRRDELTVLDVRTHREWEAGHIIGATHMPVGEIPLRSGELPGIPVATICEGGYRSALAASVLARAGMEHVLNVSGGMAAYRALGGSA